MDERLKQRLSELDVGRRRRKRARAQTSSGLAPASGRCLGAGVDFAKLGRVERDDGILIVTRSIGDLTSKRNVKRVLGALRRAARAAGTLRDDMCDVRALLENPEGAIFVDTETTGLAGSMVFLLGAMKVAGDDIELRQVFARDYQEEAELASLWSKMLHEAEMLVSFNGKSFDVPVLRDRMGLHRIESPPEPMHLDLLHLARRRWGGELPDCRLQTLEWHVCGRRRAGDIPGEEIPAVYHDFVRTGRADDILTVFHHNALDLITLAEIVVALTRSGPPRSHAV